MPAFEPVMAGVGQYPAAESGTDQLVDLKLKILAGGDAFAPLDAVKGGDGFLRELVERAWMKGAFLHGRDSSGILSAVQPLNLAFAYGTSRG